MTLQPFLAVLVVASLGLTAYLSTVTREVRSFVMGNNTVFAQESTPTETVTTLGTLQITASIATPIPQIKHALEVDTPLFIFNLAETSNREDIRVTDITLSATSAAGNLINVSLWDGTTRIAGPVNPSGSTVRFLNARDGIITIARGASPKILTVKADINSGPELLPGVIVKLSPRSITYMGVSSGQRGQIDRTAFRGITSSNFYIHEVEPVISANLEQARPVLGVYDLARFDIRADGMNDLIIKAIRIKIGGNFTSGAPYSFSLPCETGSVSITTKPGYSLPFILNFTGTLLNINLGDTTLESFRVSDPSRRFDVLRRSRYLTTSGSCSRLSSTVPETITLEPGPLNGGITGWEFMYNGVAQPFTLFASSPHLTANESPAGDSLQVSATNATSSNLRVWPGQYLTFILQNPIVISHLTDVTRTPSIITFRGDTSSVKIGRTSGFVSWSLLIDGVRGSSQRTGAASRNGVLSGKAWPRNRNNARGGLFWDYSSTVRGVSGATGSLRGGEVPIMVKGTVTMLNDNDITAIDLSDIGLVSVSATL